MTDYSQASLLPCQPERLGKLLRLKSDLRPGCVHGNDAPLQAAVRADEGSTAAAFSTVEKYAATRLKVIRLEKDGQGNLPTEEEALYYLKNDPELLYYNKLMEYELAIWKRDHPDLIPLTIKWGYRDVAAEDIALMEGREPRS